MERGDDIGQAPLSCVPNLMGSGQGTGHGRISIEGIELWNYNVCRIHCFKSQPIKLNVGSSRQFMLEELNICP